MRTAVFVDFQGTLGGEGTGDIRSLDFYSFSIPAIKMLNDNKVLAIGVTNQSKIARGKLSLDEYWSKLTDLKEQLAEYGAFFDEVYCCPHQRTDNCSCKKPRTGMIERACQDFDIDLQNSYIIGDMGKSDMLLAKNTGTKGILVLTGAGMLSLREHRDTWKDYEPYGIAENVYEAVKFIIDDIKAVIS